MALNLSTVFNLIEGGLFRDALVLLDSEPVANPATEEDADKLVLRVMALNALGRWKESVSAGSEALAPLSSLSLRKQLTQMHGLLGVAFMRTGAISKAESHYRAAIHVLTWELGDIAESLRQQKRLALMFHGLGLWKQARFEMEKAIEIADRKSVV